MAAGFDIERYRLDRKEKVDLADYDPGDKGSFKQKEDVEEAMERMKRQLEEMQEMLYASKTHGVLILFQGMDCSGKDGVVAKVLSGLNPHGFRAESFKQPTGEEAAHDFLWRAHKVGPARGMITSFNRSYYEDVLITRVHGTIDKKEANKRLKHIQQFEKHLADSGILVVKIFLHISQDFQLGKLKERLENPKKLWKFDPSDLAERKHWDAYMQAYEAAFKATGTKTNPWHIVPANHRWYRDYVTLGIIVDAMSRLKLIYPVVEIDRSSIEAVAAADE
ncbi:PPK2 family polyphosphate kinase [Cohnella fermenti]|uniref:Polyphosphate kinase 2 family protein n=1 Tax=Cohnella fermenti TaxID=2565925 RepID=A0A4V3WFI2_9BACL|nr:PPK2 family polyphosphate kinase [Cohnella fermenti]THF80320.1 polyphosphate kinase 2 family protein [Cohnella fermenti]